MLIPTNERIMVAELAAQLPLTPDTLSTSKHAGN